MPEETIRQVINKYSNRLADSSNLSPQEASQYLVELSSYSGNINSKMIEAMMAYNNLLSQTLDEIKSVAKAQVKAQCSQEYRNLQEVKGYQVLATELIRSLKYFVRASGEEFEHSRNL